MPYLQKVNLPLHLQGKQHVLFGNIIEIYTESKNFHAALKTCGYDHEKIAETFLRFVSNFVSFVARFFNLSIFVFAENFISIIPSILKKQTESRFISTRVSKIRARQTRRIRRTFRFRQLFINANPAAGKVHFIPQRHQRAVEQTLHALDYGTGGFRYGERGDESRKRLHRN